MTNLANLITGGDCTLVVANGGEIHKFHQRGVRDLMNLLDNDPLYLDGAMVADKIVGKGAAALMIKGRVKSVYARVITMDAKAMLLDAGIPVDYGSETDMVCNRTCTGRCPIDTLCASLSDIDQMVASIRDFIHQNE